MRRPAALALLLLAGGCTGLSSGGGGGSSGLPIVVFLGNGSAASLPPEEAAAWSWLRSRPELDARYVQLVDLAGADLPRQAVIWWHYAAEESLPSAAVRAETRAAVRRHLVGGGGVLLSLLAAPYVVALGFEEAPPDVVHTAGNLGADTEFGGLRAPPGHPLLERFWGGAFTAGGGRYPRRAVALYTGDRWPAKGEVWAVHQDESQVDAGTKVGLEYAAVIPGAGTLLTIGAHCYFADAANHNRPQLEQLVSDALHYLAGLPSPALPAGGATAANAARGGERTTRGGSGGVPAADAASPLPPVRDGNRRYWGRGGSVEPGVVPAEIAPTTLPIAADPQEVLNRILLSRTGPELTGYPAADTPFTLTSPQVVAAGSQLGRVDELWVHPQRILRGLRFGIVRPGRGVTWIDAGGGQHTFIARPEGSELKYNDGDVELGIHLTVDRRYPALVAVLSVRSPAALKLIAAWEVDSTASWPRDDSLYGPLELGWDDGARAAVWRDGGFAAMAGFGHPPAVHVLGYRAERDLREAGLIIEEDEGEEGEEEEEEEAGDGRGVAAQVSLAAGTTLVPFVAVGGDPAALDIDEAFAALISAPGLAWVENYNHFRGFLGNDGTTSLLGLGAGTPSQSFKDAFVWAKVGLESLRAVVPGVGAGMLSAAGGPAAADAGAAAVPELGGVGALWGAMAADAYGDRAAAADTLRLMAHYQGIDGRLPSAVSPSREVRYNAAATTPLFVIAAENHVRTWGDRALLGELWPAITRALDYGAAADRNEDGLIDGYGAADRWGGGPEVVTPIDLAALWGAALEAGARLAEWQGDGQRTAASRQGADRVRQILNQEYWDPNSRGFNFAKRRDGTFDSARTALPALPIVFRLLDPTADAALDQLAGAELSTDWGVGLAGIAPPPAESAAAAPAPDPHPLADRVDPLFTGWAALAEFARHRADAGFAHTLANLQLLGHGNLGRVPAALGRDRFEAVSGASHSAAGQALTILPVIWGLLGIRADAMDTAGGTVGGTLTVAPHLPAAWDEVTVERVRIGNDELRVRVRRRASQTHFHLTHLKGNMPLRLRLSAHVPNDVQVNLNRDLVGATLEGDEVIEESSADRSSTAVVRTTATESIVTFDHGEYPLLIAPQVTPQPGAPSQGLRVIRSRYLGGVMSIEVEGLPGTAYTLRLRAPWRIAQVTGVPNPTIGQPEAGSATIQIVIPGSGGRYQRVNLEVSFAR